jgi:ABC-type glycerol-3-phosphate transport system permease component
MKNTKRDIAKYVILSLIAFFIILPPILMITFSFKDQSQFYHKYWGFSVPLHTENYLTAWLMIARPMLNSFIYCISIVFGILLTSSFAAYSFSRFHFPGKTFFYYAIISLLMIPSLLTLIPAFLLVRNLRLLNTPWAMILPSIAGGQAFAVLILHSFFEGLPNELFEAARMDGCRESGSYYYIALPLSKAVLFIVGIRQFVDTWNMFIWPLVTIKDSSWYPMSLAIRFLSPIKPGDYGPIMAGYTIASIPLLALFLLGRRYFVEGFAGGGIGK